MDKERAFVLLVQTAIAALVDPVSVRALPKKTRKADPGKRQARADAPQQRIPFITDGDPDEQVTIADLDKIFNTANPQPVNPGQEFKDATGDAPEVLDWTGYPQ